MTPVRSFSSRVSTIPKIVGVILSLLSLPTLRGSLQQRRDRGALREAAEQSRDPGNRRDLRAPVRRRTDRHRSRGSAADLERSPDPHTAGLPTTTATASSPSLRRSCSGRETPSPPISPAPFPMTFRRTPAPIRNSISGRCHSGCPTPRRARASGRVDYADTDAGDRRGWIFDFDISANEAARRVLEDPDARFSLQHEQYGTVLGETDYYFVSNQQGIYAEQNGAGDCFLNQGTTEPATVSVYHRGRELAEGRLPPDHCLAVSVGPDSIARGRRGHREGLQTGTTAPGGHPSAGEFSLHVQHRRPGSSGPDPFPAEELQSRS